jgi:hypothetical protein
MYARKWWIVLIAVLSLTSSLAACGDGDEDEDGASASASATPGQQQSTPASGDVVTQQFDLADFTAVQAANAFAVDIVQADSFSVTVRVDNDLLDRLDVSKDGDTLRLRLEPRDGVEGDVTLEASITMPDLDSLELSGATRANVSGFSSTGPLSIELTGASRLDGDLEAGSVDMEASGASRVALEGSATDLSVRSSGASSLDLADFLVDTADIELSGASDATVNVRERIDGVDVSGASTLRYMGDPELSDVSSSGASTVEKVD